MNKIRYIALYLPQYHPVKENDQVWGKGFTEWTNVSKATPLFRGHYQPHIPADLGFYDLRLEETRIAQAELARSYGIEGFCYWYYWFGNGDKILERPINEMLSSGKPDFPFCFGWADHSWTTGTWTKVNNPKKHVVIKEQKYLGKEDYTAFFYELLPAFKDKRYIYVDDKPFFLIHDPYAIPDVDVFIQTWRELARLNGLKDIYFIASTPGFAYRDKNTGKHRLPNLNETKLYYDELLSLGFDAINSRNLSRAVLSVEGKLMNFFKIFVNTRLKSKLLRRFKQDKINEHLLTEFDAVENVFPSIYPNWDRSPRAGKADIILTDSTPQVFSKLLSRVVKLMENKRPEHRIVILTSWNEWGEGNHLEPDIKYGHGYLAAIKDSLK